MSLFGQVKEYDRQFVEVMKTSVIAPKVCKIIWKFGNAFRMNSSDQGKVKTKPEKS